MPASAIASGLVDLELAVEEMPAQARGAIRAALAPVGVHDRLDGRRSRGWRMRARCTRSCATASGHDFSGYKEKTFLRRVQPPHAGAADR